MSQSHPFNRAGFTLVEMLVVIAIIGVLIGLLIPAVQKVRTVAQRSGCANNLRQIGIGLNNHHTVLKRYPAGGWGWDWVGIPTRASSPKQPGGWLFSLLPYIEQQNLLRQVPDAGPQLASEMTKMLGAPVPIFNCPARRDGGPYPNNRPYRYGDSKGNTFAFQPQVVARSDYAGNAGSQFINQWSGGPATLAQGDDPAYPWPDDKFNGIFYIHAWISTSDIMRGTSNVFLAGDRYIDPTHYFTGDSFGDNENQFTGFDNDVNRTTFYPPMRDTPGIDNLERFGSAHAEGVNMLYADGSVRFIDYEVEPDTFLLMGQRF